MGNPVQTVSHGVSHLAGQVSQQASKAIHQPGKFITQGVERGAGVALAFASPLTDIAQLKPVHDFLNSPTANQWTLGTSGNIANFSQIGGTLLQGHDPTQQELSNGAQLGIKAAAVTAAVMGGEAAYGAYAAGDVTATGVSAATGLLGTGAALASGKYRQAAQAAGLPSFITNQIPLPPGASVPNQGSIGYSNPNTSTGFQWPWSTSGGGASSGNMASSGSSLSGYMVLIALAGIGINIIMKSRRA